MKEGTMGRWKRQRHEVLTLFFVFVLLFFKKNLLVFTLLLLFYLYFFLTFSFVGKCYKGEGQPWRGWEMSEMGVYDVKFQKNQ